MMLSSEYYLLYLLNLPPQILDRTLVVALVADKLRSQWFILGIRD